MQRYAIILKYQNKSQYFNNTIIIYNGFINTFSFQFNFNVISKKLIYIYTFKRFFNIISMLVPIFFIPLILFAIIYPCFINIIYISIKILIIFILTLNCSYSIW